MPSAQLAPVRTISRSPIQAPGRAADSILREAGDSLTRLVLQPGHRRVDHVHSDRSGRSGGCRPLRLDQPARRLDHRAPAPSPGGTLHDHRRRSALHRQRRGACHRAWRHDRCSHRRPSLRVKPGIGGHRGRRRTSPRTPLQRDARSLRWFGVRGKTTSRGAPKNPLQLGATLWHFRRENRVTSPPPWAQNLILPPLAALAKVFGVRPYYDRWDTRETPRSEPAA